MSTVVKEAIMIFTTSHMVGPINIACHNDYQQLLCKVTNKIHFYFMLLIQCGCNQLIIRFHLTGYAAYNLAYLCHQKNLLDMMKKHHYTY